MLRHSIHPQRPLRAAHSPRGREGVALAEEAGSAGNGRGEQLAMAMTCDRRLRAIAWLGHGAPTTRWDCSRKTACGRGRQCPLPRPLDQDLILPLARASAGGDHGRRSLPGAFSGRSGGKPQRQRVLCLSWRTAFRPSWWITPACPEQQAPRAHPAPDGGRASASVRPCPQAPAVAVGPSWSNFRCQVLVVGCGPPGRGAFFARVWPDIS